MDVSRKTGSNPEGFRRDAYRKKGEAVSRTPRLRVAETRRLNAPATIRAAASRQRERGRTSGTMIVTRDDLRWRPPHNSSRRLVVFAIDGSGSMASRRQMRQTKAAVLALLLELRRCRDQWAFMAFSGARANIILPPQQAIGKARRVLEELPVGGTTPLAAGLRAAGKYAEQARRKAVGRQVQVVLLTDGRANVADIGTDPWTEALKAASILGRQGLSISVIDTEAGPIRLGQAAQLAHALAAPSIQLEQILPRRQARS